MSNSKISNKENIKVRRACLLDIQRLAEIEKEYEDYPYWGIDGLKAELEKKFSVTLILEFKDEIAGFMNFWIIRPYLEINALVIARKYSGKGYASFLIKKAFDYALKNDCKEILLEVSENNIPALRLYKKNGFYETGRRIKYYNGIYDAILMRKEMNPEN